MNSFKFAFKAIKHQQQTIRKRELIFNKNINFYSTNNLLFQSKHNGINNSSKKTKIIYDQKKYLSISSIRFNETTSGGKIEEKPAETSDTNNKPPTKQGWFATLFDQKNGYKTGFGIVMLFFLGLVIYVRLSWGAPQIDETTGNPIPDEFSELNFSQLRRAFAACVNYWQMVKDPISDKLLPDPVQEPYYQPPYTLVIELTGVLVHPEWTISTGWRYKKRPGLDYFINELKYPLFEVVLFTNEPSTTIAPTVAALDPNGSFQFKLFRECTKYKNSQHIKDLKYLNRDLKKIILIDWDANAYQSQPRNALHRLKKFKGEEDDTDLVYLASLLKAIAISGVDDVRDVLDYYNGENDPLEAYKLNYIKYKEEEEKKKKEIEASKKKTDVFSSKSLFSWSRR